MKNTCYQSDYALGLEIQKILLDAGIENPVNTDKIKAWNDPAHMEQLTGKLAMFFDELGIYRDSNDCNHTANRLIDYWCQQLFYGLDYNCFPEVNPMSNEFAYHNPLIAEDIQFTSTCEHHLVPIHGVAVIAYKPDKIVVGLNKLNAILDFFTHRPQLQERLTRQIFITLKYILQTEDIAVLIRARHDCICSNGITDFTSFHSSFELGGVFSSDTSFKQHLLDKLK